MTLGAIVVPLLALALGCGGLWFAWWLVRAASREGESPPESPAAESAAQSARAATADHADVKARAPARAAGQVGVVLVAGGACLALPTLFNLAALWELTVAGLGASACGALLLWINRRRGR